MPLRSLLARPARAVMRGAAASPLGWRLLDRSHVEIERVLSSADNRRRWHTDVPTEPLTAPDRPVLTGLNRLCALEDWDIPAVAATIRRQLPYFVEAHPEFPARMQHRKHWEFAQVVLGLQQLGAVHPRADVLAIGAGHEAPVYDLTTLARRVWATDLYGAGQFRDLESDARMLVEPELYARCHYNRKRLVVKHMDALDLRFEPGSFDAVYSLSSVEHFGGMQGAARALREMARVLKPGGIAAITTECIVNGEPAHSEPGLELFTPELIRELAGSAPGLEPVEAIDTALGPATAAIEPISLHQALTDDRNVYTRYPHVLLEHQGRHYTSVAVFLRRV